MLLNTVKSLFPEKKEEQNAVGSYSFPPTESSERNPSAYDNIQYAPGFLLIPNAVT